MIIHRPNLLLFNNAPLQIPVHTHCTPHISCYTLDPFSIEHTAGTMASFTNFLPPCPVPSLPAPFPSLGRNSFAVVPAGPLHHSLARRILAVILEVKDESTSSRDPLFRSMHIDCARTAGQGRLLH